MLDYKHHTWQRGAKLRWPRVPKTLYLLYFGTAVFFGWTVWQALTL